MDEELVIPAFATEAEEAEWWDAHRDLVTRRLRKANNDGRLRFVPPAPGREKVVLKLISLRVSEADLSLAQKQAERKGLPYQTYIKSLLHETLEAREGQEATAPAL